jgi:hypothetical protein
MPHVDKAPEWLKRLYIPKSWPQRHAEAVEAAVKCAFTQPPPPGTLNQPPPPLVQPVSSEKVKEYLDQLQYCVIMNMGFQDFWGAEEQCYCPCSRRGKPFRQIFGIDQDFPECAAKEFGSPKDLVDHLDQLGKSEIYHYATHYYLYAVYDKYLRVQDKPPMRHHAFYKRNDENDKKYRKLEDEKRQQYVDSPCSMVQPGVLYSLTVSHMSFCKDSTHIEGCL